METLVLKIDEENPEGDKIREAAEIIRNGGLVAFPTETVYGLGASAFNGVAVRKIFEAKGRPGDNPLIVHVSNQESIYDLARDVPGIARELATEFWPGPLTYVLKKNGIVPDEVTAKLDSVAVRMPSNNIALALIKEAGPIAAPSANISGKPSATKFEHVLHDFEGRIDCIIEGGDSMIGLESTVVSLIRTPPVLLRPGGISLEQLRKFIPDIRGHEALFASNLIGKPICPGMKYKHYSPDALVILVEGEKERVESKMRELESVYLGKGKKVYVMGVSEKVEVARHLFGVFREGDSKGYDCIIVPGVDEKGIGLAIMNRLRKAASEIVKA